MRLQGAQSCIAAAELAQRVEARLGRVIFVSAADATIFVDGTVERAQDNFFVVRLQLSDQQGRLLGERVLEFEGADCREIDEAVVLVIAVTLFPENGLSGAAIPMEPELASRLAALFDGESTDPDPNALPKASPPVVEQSDAGESSKPKESDQANEDNARQPWVAMFAGLGAGLGVTPRVGAEAHLAGTLWLTPEMALELTVNRYWSQTLPIAGGRLRFGLFGGGAVLCPWRLFVPDAQLCLGGELAWLHVTSDKFPRPGTDTRDLLLNAQVAAVYRKKIAGPLALRLAAVAEVPLIQRGYEVEASNGLPKLAFRTSPLMGKVEFGLGAAF